MDSRSLESNLEKSWTERQEGWIGKLKKNKKTFSWKNVFSGLLLARIRPCTIVFIIIDHCFLIQNKGLSHNCIIYNSYKFYSDWSNSP